MIRTFAEDVNPIPVVAESLLGGFGFVLVSTAVGMYAGFAIGVETPEYNMLPSLAFFGGCGIALSLTGWWFGWSVCSACDAGENRPAPGLIRDWKISHAYTSPTR